MSKEKSNINIVNANEHLDIPKWITEEYFQSVLAKDEPDYVRVLNFTPVAAIPPGENFTSIMLRIHFELELKDGSIKHKTYIFKTELASERGGKEIKMLGIFNKELKMYQSYLPAFEGLYRAAGSDIQLSPKCLHIAERDDEIHFVFEDLCVKNFKNVDRIKGLDMEHMKRTLQKLAEFHAAGAVYAEKNGPFPKEFDEGFFSKSSLDFSEKFFEVSSRSFRKAMTTWGLDDAEKYVKSFPNTQQYLQMCLRNLEVDPQEFNTLVHGDYWSSNLMCNYHKNGDIDELIMVDFQLCKWGNPAQDLLFIITLSAALDIRLKYFDTFVRIYWEHLVECLKLLKYQKPLPKLREIQMSMYKENNTFYAFMAVTNHLPLIQFPTDKESNLHTNMRDDEEGDQFRMRVNSNPAFAQIMKDLYPFYYNRGIFRFGDFEQN